ncbi:MAG: TIGR02266 family protein [candidate division NC10 bacterium]|nr:TIGR02266 family protein [candidate division NC10 bacterium]
MAERRTEARAEVEIEVHYRTPQEFLAAYSKNISGGGIYIRTQEPHPLNTNTLLRFTLPGISRRFQVSGIVVWSNPAAGRSSFPAGMGVKFLEVGEEDAALIADFVSKAQGHATQPVSETEPVTPAAVSAAPGAVAPSSLAAAPPAPPAGASRPPPPAGVARPGAALPPRPAPLSKPVAAPGAPAKPGQPATPPRAGAPPASGPAARPGAPQPASTPRPAAPIRPSGRPAAGGQPGTPNRPAQPPGQKVQPPPGSGEKKSE